MKVTEFTTKLYITRKTKAAYNLGQGVVVVKKLKKIYVEGTYSLAMATKKISCMVCFQVR
jgi:hypothetical protein